MADRMPRSSCACTGVRSAASIANPPQGLTKSMYYYISTMSTGGGGGRETAAGRLLDGDAFCEISGLIDVAATPHGDVIRQQLQRDDHQHRREQRMRRRHRDQEILGRIEQPLD